MCRYFVDTNCALVDIEFCLDSQKGLPLFNQPNATLSIVDCRIQHMYVDMYVAAHTE